MKLLKLHKEIIDKMGEDDKYNIEIKQLKKFITYL